MDLSSLVGMFVGVHAVLAMQTKTPELAMSNEEGAAFAKAAQNVMKHYSVQTTQKTVDWISFLGITAGIYGTRVLAITNRHKEERRGGHKGPAEVLHFRPRPKTASGQPVAEPPASPDPQAGDYIPVIMPETPGDEHHGF